MMEFLLALLTIVLLWSHVGGQVHLDLMPWYAKLVLTVTMALVSVLGTKASISERRAWNGKTLACLVIALAIAAGMGVLTYYYHLHEADEEEEGKVDSIALLMASSHARHQAA
jgi:Ni/Fe-hydrogenase subunit HybB-like protein